MKRLVFLGPPGVGKGTQAGLLAESLGVPAISTGDLFRAHVRDQTDLGREVASIVGGGGYVPDRVTNDMIAQRLDEPDALGGFLLDGYPRTVGQVDALRELLAASGLALDAVLLLDAPRTLVIERLSKRAVEQGRSDDTPEVIGKRLEMYEAETQPVVERYEAAGLLQRVDGSGPIELVAVDIRNVLGIRPDGN